MIDTTYPTDMEYSEQFRAHVALMCGRKGLRLLSRSEPELANRAWWAKRGSQSEVEDCLLRALHKKFGTTPFLATTAERHCADKFHPAFFRTLLMALAKRGVLGRTSPVHAKRIQKYYVLPQAAEQLLDEE